MFFVHYLWCMIATHAHAAAAVEKERSKQMYMKLKSNERMMTMMMEDSSHKLLQLRRRLVWRLWIAHLKIMRERIHVREWFLLMKHKSSLLHELSFTRELLLGWICCCCWGVCQCAQIYSLFTERKAIFPYFFFLFCLQPQQQSKENGIFLEKRKHVYFLAGSSRRLYFSPWRSSLAQLTIKSKLKLSKQRVYAGSRDGIQLFFCGIRLAIAANIYHVQDFCSNNSNSLASLSLSRSLDH